MSPAVERSPRVRVVRCDSSVGCFRYIVSCADGGRGERSRYAFVDPHGVRLAGELRVALIATIV